MMDDQLTNFKHALKANAESYALALSSVTLEQLCVYYELLTRWNNRLHLVAPCSPEEFATRHVLESLLLLKHLTNAAEIADIGSGAGLPMVPCLIARPDLKATLIESSQKKTVFLREALKEIGASGRATIIGKPFEETTAPRVSYVTCRALDQFMSKVSTLLKWAPNGSSLLLFGGESLRKQLVGEGATFEESLIPLSERRFLFVVTQ